MFKYFYYSLASLGLLGASCLISSSLYANKDFSVSGRRQIARAEERKNAKENSPVADSWGDINNPNNQNQNQNQNPQPMRRRKA